MSQIDEWLDLLRACIKHKGSIKAAAEFVGVSPAAVSTAIAGKYPGKTDKLRAKVLNTLLSAVDCPHLAERITHDVCTRYRTRSIPTSDPDKLRHWAVCQTCPIGDDLGLPRNKYFVEDKPHAAQ